MGLVTGTLLGRYSINSLLGKGGMGEVYLAQDTQLRRMVALKLLPSEYANDTDRICRFKQEACAASLLSHPNIVTIYEIGQEGPHTFIAMEFVDGETLRQRLNRAQMPVKEALDITVQVAEALAATHALGIIHRDIKPENVMLRKDGYVKVLDFGLAKLTEQMLAQMATSEASTMTNVNTDQGAIVGTSNYMSPEQLRGLPIDGRADIWSLGVVLYEMLAVGLPFKGHTTGEVIVSILERDPAPLTLCRPEVPSELQQVVARALCKNREARYQTAKEFLLDLKNFRQDMELEARESSLAQPDFSKGKDTRSLRAAVGTDPIAVQTSDLAVETNPDGALADKGVTGRSTLNTKYSLERLRRHKISAFIALLMLMAAAVISYFSYKVAQRSLSAESLQRMKVTRLTLPGDVKEAAISHDGKYIVTIVDDAGKQSLFVRELATSADIQVVAPADDKYKGLAFSPDDSYVYYLKEEQETGTLFRVPKLGGTQRRLLMNVNTTVTFSPDGRRMAFVRYDLKEQTTVLMTATVDGTDEQELATRKRPEFFTLGVLRAGGPSWSPDGKVIACPTTSTTELSRMDVVAVQAKDGSVKRISSQKWSAIEQLAWLPDGSGLVMNAVDQTPSPFQIWLLNYPNGEARKITNDPNFYESVTLTRDANTLVTVQFDQLSNIWIVSNGKINHTQITASKHKGLNGIAWMPDGKIVYTSSESGDQDIWVMDADGSNRKRLTFDGQANIQPIVSPDGRHIVFVSYRTGEAHIWRMDADGTNPKQLTYGRYEDTPQFSPDGQWVIYHSIQPAKDSAWKVSIDGGSPELITDRISLQPVVSPDGKMLACFSREERTDAPWKIAITSFEGGQVIKFFDIPRTVNPVEQALRWTSDGRALAYIVTTGGASNIWLQPLDSNSPHQLTDFKEDQIFSFAWSFSGDQLACVRGIMTRDVIVRRNFR